VRQAENLRNNIRVKPNRLIINIHNGVRAVDGCIVDISFDGMKVSQLTNRFFIDKCKLVSVVKRPIQIFELEICPRWINRTFPGNYQEVGFEIVEPSESWKKFVQTIPPEPTAMEL
jgi:hypothetical protein